MNLPPINTITDALIVVDLQPDFLDYGPLPVKGGGEILDGIEKVIRIFSTVVATQDWHPTGHISFASTHGAPAWSEREINGRPATLWPDHCVQGTLGAELPYWLERRADLILRKGAAPLVDSYSAFNENYGPDGKRHSTGLMGFLFERRIRRVFLCGLARDICVKFTAEDAAQNGALKTFFLWDLTRAVKTEDDARTERELVAAGVGIVR